MCGIAGIIGNKASNERLDAMLAKINHRGPDYRGKWVLPEKVALGHNRLSIIDLSSESNQPMPDNTGRYQLVFNGEIYNYKELKTEIGSSYNFKTNGDSEVLLAAYSIWGAECLNKLNGMFSFAIWDTKEETLFAARDRFGVKPLYYTIVTGNLFFSSEIKELWETAVPKKLNNAVMASYLAFGTYGNPNETFWQGVNQLPGGHILTFKQGSLSINKWYNFENNIQHINTTLSENEAINYYEHLLIDSVKLRFRADVKVGFNISGGLDSSTLLSMVYHNYPDNKSINAFTFITGDENYDELPWVESMIKQTGYPLNTCLLSPQDVPDIFEKINYVQDEPFGGLPTLAYASIFKKAREMSIIVLLDGQGSDEQWAGYDYYIKNTNSVVQGTTSSPVKPDSLSADLIALAAKHGFPKPFNNDVQNTQFRDLFYTKIPRALRFNDRVSMAYSTELREPLLDYRMVEFAFAQPTDFKIKDGVQKWLLRKLTQKYLPNDITLAPKRPLQTPQREWLRGELKDWTINKIELLKKSELGSMLNHKVIDRETDNFMQGNSDNSFYIWQWINVANI